MLPNPGPGKLIVLEGLDGAGTTTQSPQLARWLRQHRGVEKVYVTREPSPGAVGALIRPVLTRRIAMDGRTLASLFVADRLDHLYAEDGVIERLRAGEWVIMDRYYLSSFAYQALALGQEELRWLWYLHEPCVAPDVTFFLDVPVRTCIERVGFARAFHFELFEEEDILHKVYEQYLFAIRRFRSVGQNIQLIDGTQPIKKVAETIRARLTMMFLDDTALSAEEQRATWKEWPTLAGLVKKIEEYPSLNLAFVTMKKIPVSSAPDGRGGSQGGYRLEFANLTQTYHVMAYFTNLWRELRLVPQGRGDEVLTELRKICPRTIPRQSQQSERLLEVNG